MKADKVALSQFWGSILSVTQKFDSSKKLSMEKLTLNEQVSNWKFSLFRSFGQTSEGLKSLKRLLILINFCIQTQMSH